MFASQTYFLQQLAVLAVCHGLTAADGGSQYFLVQRPMSWDRSREFCQRHYLDLAVLSTVEDYFHLINVTASEKVNFWLGLQRSEERSWTWVDGEALNYQQWWENRLGHCGSFEAMVKKDKKMLSRFCHEPHAFVCEGPQAPATVSVVSGSDHIVLSWNVSSLMQMMSHSYNVTSCSHTCTTTFYHHSKGTSSITITIFNLTSDTEYTFGILAALIRPDNNTGAVNTLMCSPTILLVKTEDTYWHYTIISIIRKSSKVMFLVPPLWVLYLIRKKGELKGSAQDMSFMDRPVEDSVVDIFPVRTRAVG